MREWTRLLIPVVGLLVLGPRALADLRYFDDAPLRAVQFIDDKEGWAVGDEGVVWHTLDGGKSWARLPTGVRASLRSVHFLTPEVGWVVGREELPYGDGLGVLLFTRDGGLKWQRLLTGSLPGLNQVRFIDRTTGYLLGDGCDQFPSGVFKTTDGGRSWEPVPGPRTTTWHGGDFLRDGRTGLLGGAWARLGKLAGDKFHAAEDLERLDGRDVRGVQILPERVVAVAQGGLVLTSVSAGAKWGFADLKLPAEVLASLDFHALHAAGRHVWVVGRPGSVVLHSGDGGASWQLQKTGQPLPLHGVYFFDEERGWAVGEAGTILATSDGGKSWQVQRRGGTRAAALVVHARGADTPFDLLTQLGAGEGYLATSLRVAAPDPASSALTRSAGAMRYGAAVRAAGGLTGEALWAFPLPQYLDGGDRQAVLDQWNRRHAGEAGLQLLRQLVLALRVWRPDVVVSDDPESKSPASSLVAEAVQEALRQAGDPKAFPEQIEQLGLEPWAGTKLYRQCGPGAGHVVQDNDRVPTGLTGTVLDFADAAASLLSDRPTPLPRERHLRPADGQPAAAHLMAGVVAKEGEARRRVGPTREPPAELAEALRQKQQLVALAERLDDPGAMQTQLLPVLARLPEEHAAPAAFAVASQYARRGRWDLAEETYLLLVERYPSHPLCAEACRWLIRHNASGEGRRRTELKQSVVRADLKLGPQRAPGEKTIVLDPEAAVTGKGRLTLMSTNVDEQNWNRAAPELARRLGTLGSLFASDPAVQFCVQSARRQSGDENAAAEWYGKFSKHVTSGPWHAAAVGELWHAGRSPQAPRRHARCRLTDARPRLDGDFDDACWHGLKPMVLENAAGDAAKEHPTRAWLAYDHEFLYVALECKHPEGRHVPPVKARPRDADLDAYDRVSLLLDLDRDYATYFRLEVDQRGCVREDCCGDAGWNPRWFVAVKSDATSWRIEAAIPLGELTSKGVALNSAWACNVVRVTPGRGVQSWSQPADVRPRPEGMSLLVFQQDADRGAAAPMPPPR